MAPTVVAASRMSRAAISAEHELCMFNSLKYGGCNSNCRARFFPSRVVIISRIAKLPSFVRVIGEVIYFINIQYTVSLSSLQVMESSASPSRDANNEPSKDNGSSASLEDDLDALIESCFTNSPALTMKPLPVPPSLADAPATPLSLGDDEQFMAWLNEGSPDGLAILPSPELNRSSVSPNEKFRQEGTPVKCSCFLLHLN